ncbi:hypothetical protein FBU31_007418, partial [Coemansia sp. 'formosensis']
MNDDAWDVPVFSASSDALWLLADTGFGGRKVGRSASCYEPAVARRRGFMRRPSSCASEADYFNAAVEHRPLRSPDAKRTPLYRTPSLSSLLDGEDALVPGSLEAYRSKLARLSTMPAMQPPAHSGDPTEVRDAGQFYPLASRTAVALPSADVAVVAQVPPPPRPQFLRQLGHRPSSLLRTRSSDGASSLPMVTSEEKSPTTLHYAALVDVAHIPEHRGDNSVSGAGRLARFTRQLMTGLSFGARQQESCSAPSPGFRGTVATFDSANHEVRSSMVNVPRPAHGVSWPDDSTATSPSAATFAAEEYPPTAAAAAAASGRLNMRFVKNKPGATKRSTLTIPTARTPLFMPNLLLMPVTSPASASLQTEVATASASTMVSPLLHPASAECSGSMFFDTAALLDGQPQLHTAPI